MRTRRTTFEDKDLWVESKVQGRDEHLFIGGRRGSAENVHIVVDGETGESGFLPKTRRPLGLLERVEVILTTKDGKSLRSTRAVLEFLR